MTSVDAAIDNLLKVIARDNHFVPAPVAEAIEAVRKAANPDRPVDKPADKPIDPPKQEPDFPSLPVDDQRAAIQRARTNPGIRA